jgi:hypothetical protein
MKIDNGKNTHIRKLERDQQVRGCRTHHNKDRGSSRSSEMEYFSVSALIISIALSL